MRIKRIKIKNFRGYQDEVTVSFDDLTAFVGKNDIGKSSILEALDVFFNDGKGVVKLDKEDVNVYSRANDDKEIVISVCFTELPERIIIDETNETSLANEFLLNSVGDFEVVKKYPNGGFSKIYIKVNHPSNGNCADLLQKKDSELRRLIDGLGIACPDKTRNAVMRSTNWDYYHDDLQLTEREIDVSRGDAKSIWDKLQKYLPLYTLFQSDRKNTDGDNEVQDPLKTAVKEILREEDLRQKLNQIAEAVETKLKEVSARTLEKLREMSPEVADTLEPVIPSSDSLKWSDVFKSVSIAGDQNIPINKRGSGVKRLILLNFFRAEVERRRSEQNASSVIYAIEEPETSQHTENQRKLIRSLDELSRTGNTQVIITSHSASLVKELNFNNIRIVSCNNGTLQVDKVHQNQLPYPSLNEVNYLAFSEISEEYHNELYGYIEEQGWLNDYIQGKPTRTYIRLSRNGTTKEEQRTLTEYIRHLIHHPENTYNTRFTLSELQNSIEAMRNYIADRT